MKKIKFLSAFIFLISINTLFAQPISPINDDVAHRRYWYYRTRMINDFMKVGTGQGDCIVLAERNQGATDNTSKVGPDQIDLTNQYLLALALEYKFLRTSGQSAKETLKEIYSLLYTINRLDKEADQFWGNSAPTNDIISPNSSSNGFMLREDMPKNYFAKTASLTNNYVHYNYSIRENSSATNPTGYTGLAETTVLDDDNNFSYYEGFGGSKFREQLTLPHDKYYSMFLAFMYLIKYIPDNTGYVDENGALQYFQDMEWDIKTEIRAITNRCHTYLRGNTFGNNLSNWTMEYPNGNNLTNLGKVLWYSYPLATMICKINQDYPWSVSCLNKQDGVSSTVGLAWYEALNINPIPADNPIVSLEDGSVFIAYCQAGSNSQIGINSVGTTMHNNCVQNGTEWAEIMRMVLHRTSYMYTPFELFGAPLGTAPCIGPYNFGNGLNGGYEWSSQDRHEHQSKRGTNAPFAGNYPGVDYMLLHNLYYEYLCQENINGKYTQAVNLMDNYDEMTWPVDLQHITGNPNSPNVTYGINGNIASQKVFQNFSSTAKIFAAASPSAPINSTPSEVEYRAGKVISLLPGFSVEQGSKFSAYVARYLCINGNDYGNGMKSSNTPTNDYESDLMNTSIPIHHVNYPPTNSEYLLYENSTTKNSIKNIPEKGSLTILPNPNNGNFIITNDVNEGSLKSIEIQNSLGIIIQTINQPTPSTEINIQNQAAGLYLVKLNYADKVITKKVVKQ